MPVVSCNDPAWNEALTNWVIDPLTDAEQKEAKKREECVALDGSVGVKCECPNHSRAAEDSESVPPVFNLHPGEWITHIAINNLPKKLSHRWRR